MALPSPGKDSLSDSSYGKTVPIFKVDKGESAFQSTFQDEPHMNMGSDMMPPEDQLIWPTIRSFWRDAFSETLGTMILVLFGDGSVAQVVLSKNQKGDYSGICWGWGIGVMLGAYVAGKSGGHMNPAVSLASGVYRGFPWRKVPIYALSQLVGAMIAAAILYGNYKSAIDNFEGGRGLRTVTGPNSSAGIFATYPAPFMTKTGMFFSEFLASALLQFVLFAMTDNGNSGAGPLLPLGLFFLLFGIGACFGWETGYAINPARDFGPRLISYWVGYGSDVWSAGDYYFWIPMVAPFLGCLTGGGLYDLFIYTSGDSPVNMPYLGFKRLAKPRRSVWSNTYRTSAESKV